MGDHWCDRVLYKQTAHRLRSALAGREHTVVVDVPYRHRAEPLVAGDVSDAGPGNDTEMASSA
jgi:hypothetical protein